MAPLMTLPHWIISLGGIPLIILAAVHAIITHPLAHKILRPVIMYLSILFIFCLGMIAFVPGIILPDCAEWFSDSVRFEEKCKAYSSMFTGLILASLSWTGQMMAWTYYQVDEGIPYTRQ